MMYSQRYNIPEMKKNFIQGMMDNKLLLIAPSADQATWFTLKSGKLSPWFWNLQKIQSYPQLFRMMIIMMADAVEKSGIEFDHVIGVPEGAKTLAAGLGIQMLKSILVLRPKPKDHGQGGLIIGEYKEGDRALIIEDVGTSGGSVYNEIVAKLEQILGFTDALVGMDRQEGAKQFLAEKKINLLSVFTQTDAIEYFDPKHPMNKVIMNYVGNNIVR